jgi:hypothetical protein
MTARGTGADYGLGLVRCPRPNPLLALWRWRYETAAAANAGLLAAEVGPTWTVFAGVAFVVGAGAVPVVRHRAVARAWCIVTPHRVRTACKHAWIHSRTGRIPAVLWTRPVAAGEEVLLWCRPGTTAGDMAAARPVLATTCWAEDVRVEPHPSRPQLVRLTVVRRTPPPSTGG